MCSAYNAVFSAASSSIASFINFQTFAKSVLPDLHDLWCVCIFCSVFILIVYFACYFNRDFDWESIDLIHIRCVAFKFVWEIADYGKYNPSLQTNLYDTRKINKINCLQTPTNPISNWINDFSSFACPNAVIIIHSIEIAAHFYCMSHKSLKIVCLCVKFCKW